MKLKSFKCILILLLVTFTGLTSCKKEIIYEWPKGDLKGRVKLADYSDNSIDFTDVLITLQGAGFSRDEHPDAEGMFNFKDVETGVYDIIFTKPGYETYKELGFQFMGGKVPMYMNPVTLYR